MVSVNWIEFINCLFYTAIDYMQFGFIIAILFITF